ncbi:hypothetical protein TNCV_1961271 [Trichonephila clavipes]|nr:hypothetical protein TNCV_1961271 [Trichonephila clavipes]
MRSFQKRSLARSRLSIIKSHSNFYPPHPASRQHHLVSVFLFDKTVGFLKERGVSENRHLCCYSNQQRAFGPVKGKLEGSVNSFPKILPPSKDLHFRYSKRER